METPKKTSARGNHPVQVQQQRSKKGHKRRTLRRTGRKLFRLIPVRIVLVVVLLSLVIPAALMAGFATDSFVRVQEAALSVERTLAALEGQSFVSLTLSDFDRLTIATKNLSDNLRLANTQTALLRQLSASNKSLRNEFLMLDAASSAASGMLSLLDGLGPVAQSILVSNSAVIGKKPVRSADQVVDYLRIGTSRFIEAGNQATKAQQIVQSIDPGSLPADLFLQYLTMLDYVEKLSRAASLLQKAPDTINALLAYDQPQNYLILSQNNDELRPSGGYISTFGWLQLQNARIMSYGYSATSVTSPQPPPNDIAGEIRQPSWWFKSANPLITAWSGSWYADFEQTAKLTTWYYDQGNNPLSPVNTVIGVDITGFQYLLGAIGNVTIPEYSETINASNFRQVLYRLRTESLNKEFLAQAYRQIMVQWQQITRDRGIELLSAMLRGIQEKHILIYSNDPAINEALSLLNWNGTQKPGTGDYLMIADANLGNKSNSSVTRTLRYNVAIQPDKSLNSHLILDYTYDAQLAANDPAVAPQHYGNQKDYYNLLQVFTPVGTAVTRADGLQAALSVDSTTVSGLTVLATGVVVPFASSLTLTFDYNSPDKIGKRDAYSIYRLVAQKQPGTQNDSLSVQVTLPPGATLVNASPIPVASYTLDTTILEFRMTLSLDREIVIIYK